MGLFDKMFNKKSNDQNSIPVSGEKSEHAVIIKFNYGMKELKPLHDLEDLLEKVISESKVGEYDGHEIAVDGSDGFLYMYGPNAEILFKTIKPTLESSNFMKGAIAKLRFGPPKSGVKEIDVEL